MKYLFVLIILGFNCAGEEGLDGLTGSQGIQGEKGESSSDLLIFDIFEEEITQKYYTNSDINGDLMVKILDGRFSTRTIIQIYHNSLPVEINEFNQGWIGIYNKSNNMQGWIVKILVLRQKG